jgi:hypothetical protein
VPNTSEPPSVAERLAARFGEEWAGQPVDYRELVRTFVALLAMERLEPGREL